MIKTITLQFYVTVYNKNNFKTLQTRRKKITANFKIYCVLNCSMYSDSKGCSSGPGIINECNGAPKSVVAIFCKEQAKIFCVSEPTLANPISKERPEISTMKLNENLKRLASN